MKDRFKPQSENEKTWYDRAFGPLRNIMKVELSFTPTPEIVTPGKFQLFAKLNYTMFPEMREEFKEEDYALNELIPLEVEQLEGDLVEYYLDLELPYGLYDPKLFIREIDGQAASGDI